MIPAGNPVTCLTAGDRPLLATLQQRQDYFSREISEVIRSVVKARILVLGAGHMKEASDALYAGHLYHAEFVALEPDATLARSLRQSYVRCPLQVFESGWEQFAPCDLIYSLSWLDAMSDEQALGWLSAGADLLRPGGRILAANFTSCRSEEQLAQLVIQLKHPQVRGHAVFRDEGGTSAYLEIYSL